MDHLSALTALALDSQRNLRNVLESIDALNSQPRTPPTKKTKKRHSSAPRQNEQHGKESWQNEQQGEQEQHGEERRRKWAQLINKPRPPIDYSLQVLSDRLLYRNAFAKELPFKAPPVQPPQSLHSWNTQDALRMQPRVVPPPPRVVPPPPAAREVPAMEIADDAGRLGERLRVMEDLDWQFKCKSEPVDSDSDESDPPIVSPGPTNSDSESENEEQKVHDEEQAAEQSKETWQRVYREQGYPSLLPLPQGLGYGQLIAEESWHGKAHGSTENWQEHVGYGKGKDGDKGGGKSNDGGKDGGKSKDGGKDGGQSKDGGKDGGKSKDGGKGGSKKTWQHEPQESRATTAARTAAMAQMTARMAARAQTAAREAAEDLQDEENWERWGAHGEESLQQEQNGGAKKHGGRGKKMCNTGRYGKKRGGKTPNVRWHCLYAAARLHGPGSLQRWLNINPKPEKPEKP